MSNGISIIGSCLMLIAIYPAVALADTIRYLGLCEASAAAVLDDTHFAVASDDSEKLRIYETGTETPVSDAFRQAGVTDIEGAARIGNVVFWVTSHSLNKSGIDKPERQLLFATTVGKGPELVAIGVPYRKLRADVAEALGVAESNLMAELNIEGAAATAMGSLLLGLRGPLDASDRGSAYVLEIDNPTEIVKEGVEGARARIVKIHRLKLFDDSETKGRGIRSIEKAGDRYIVVAGTVQDSSEPARLYSWDGVSDDGLTLLSSPDLGGLVPEALMAWSNTDIQILGDNGGVFVDGKECNDKKEKPPGVWFPSARFKADAP